MLRQATRLLPKSTRSVWSQGQRPLMTTTEIPPEPPFALPLDTLIKADHNKVRHLFNVYDRAESKDHKQLVAYNIIREISMHSSKEEEVVYPAVGKLYGSDVQQHLLDEHYVLKVKLDRLSGMELMKDEAAFDKQVASVKSEFMKHIREEEEEEIPRLLKSPGVSATQMGLDFELAAAHAITRPHPMAPDKPPLNWFTNRMTAPLDAMADQVRFGGQVPGSTAPPNP